MPNSNCFTTLALLSIPVLFGGCGAAPEGEEYANEDVASFEAALSEGEKCNTVAADKTVPNNFIQSFVSPATYGKAGCGNGYIVDVTSYSSSKNHTGNRIVMEATGAGTKAGCEKLKVNTYAWEMGPNNTTTFLGAQSDWGTWIESTCPTNPQPCFVGMPCEICADAECEVPNISIDRAPVFQGKLKAGRKIRFASSARVHTRPKDGNSAYTTTKILFFNAKVIATPR